MKRIVSLILMAAFISSVSGCATLKNTKVPEEFSDLGICPSCRQVIAVDGFSANEIAVCPECGSDFLVKAAKDLFKKKCVDLKNKKTASSVFMIALMAASIAGAIYGIPIPPPPIDEETFMPFEYPVAIAARMAEQPQLSEPPSAVETPAIKPPADMDLSMPRAFNDRYSFYESPYSIVIADEYRASYDYMQGDVPYNISMGKIGGECYDAELIGTAYRLK